mgnify:CR=1 FL=1|jgi:hypothetical protein
MTSHMLRTMHRTLLLLYTYICTLSSCESYISGNVILKYILGRTFVALNLYYIVMQHHAKPNDLEQIHVRVVMLLKRCNNDQFLLDIYSTVP